MFSVPMFWICLFILVFSIQAQAKAIQIKIRMPIEAIAKGSCSQSIRLEVLNESGMPEKINKAIVVHLKSVARDLAFFADDKCVKKISSIDVLSGESSTLIYIRATAAGAKSIVVSSPGYLGDIKALAVQ